MDTRKVLFCCCQGITFCNYNGTKVPVFPPCQYSNFGVFFHITLGEKKVTFIFSLPVTFIRFIITACISFFCVHLHLWFWVHGLGTKIFSDKIIIVIQINSVSFIYSLIEIKISFSQTYTYKWVNSQLKCNILWCINKNKFPKQFLWRLKAIL